MSSIMWGRTEEHEVSQTDRFERVFDAMRCRKRKLDGHKHFHPFPT